MVLPKCLRDLQLLAYPVAGWVLGLRGVEIGQPVRCTRPLADHGHNGHCSGPTCAETILPIRLRALLHAGNKGAFPVHRAPILGPTVLSTAAC